MYFCVNEFEVGVNDSTFGPVAQWNSVGNYMVANLDLSVTDGLLLNSLVTKSSSRDSMSFTPSPLLLRL